MLSVSWGLKVLSPVESPAKTRVAAAVVLLTTAPVLLQTMALLLVAVLESVAPVAAAANVKSRSVEAEVEPVVSEPLRMLPR